MTRLCLVIVASLLATACDRSDYVINLKRGHIERVDRLGGSGYVIVDRASAETMAKYGSVYLDGRSCPEVTCKTFPVGTLDHYDGIPVEGGVRLNIMPWEVPANDAVHPPFWLRNAACLKIEATQGFMGRTGKSGWSCSVTSSAK